MQPAASAALTPLSGEGVEPAESATTERGRGVQGRLLAGEADRLRWAAGVLGECEAGVPGEALRAGDRGEFVRHFAGDEIACTLGISLSRARDLLWLAERLATVMPCALTALGQARLDVGRVRVLAEATSVLDDATAAAVATELVTALEAPVWDGPSPRAWRARVQRAVVAADAAAAAARRARALAARRVQAWAEDDAIGVLQVRADAADITVVDQVLSDLAHARPAHDPETGQATTLDQRRADALIEVFRSVRDGAALPVVPVRRVHDLGLVLHADTLLADGPRSAATGQLRGLGAPTPLDAASARQLAARQLASGTAVQVLLVDHTGALAHVVRLTDTQTACAPARRLLAAVRRPLAAPTTHGTPTATGPAPPSPAT